MAARPVRLPAWFPWFAAALLGPSAGGPVARGDCFDHARPAIPVGPAAQAPGLAGPPREGPTAPDPVDAPRPCTGPSCSRAPAAPATTPAPDRRPSDSGLVACPPAPPRPLDGRQIAVPSPAGYASPAVEPLDRPPRP